MARLAAAVALALLCVPGAAVGSDVRSDAVGGRPAAAEGLVVWEQSGGLWAAAGGSPFPLARGGASADVARNAANRELLVVWEAASGSLEAARLDSGGRRLGEPVRVADRGTDPRAAWNAGEREYLVVWEGRGSIESRRLSASGAPLDSGPQRLVEIGTAFCRPGPLSACNPDVAHSPRAQEYLLVWHDDVPGDDFEDEVHALRLARGARPLGPAFQVSFTGFDPADAIFTQATNPSVAWNPVSGEFLVAWESFTVADQEIVGQRVPPSGGGFVPANLPISDAPGGALERSPRDADVAASDRSGEYLVAWEVRSGEGVEVRAQRLSGAGAETGAGDFLLATPGRDPAVAFDRDAGTFVVTWGP